MLSAYSRTKLVLLLATTIAGGLIGTGYVYIIGGRLHFGMLTGCLISLGVLGFELYYVHTAAGAWLRRLPFVALLLVSPLVWTVIIVASLQLVPRFYGESMAYPEFYQGSTFEQDVVFAMLVSFALNGVLRIRSLIGGRVLLNFLLGRYNRPLRESRIFMFLDLADSTSLAEQLGDIEVQSLIRQFFFDIARPIVQSGGETHRYIGDEIVVTWPLLDSRRNRRVLDCVLEIRRLIRRREKFYLKRFGVTPGFRIGLHGGSVVASEVGDDKREIVYFGDTVNTASRLQALCKELGCEILISQDLLRKSELPEALESRPMGRHTPKGKERDMSIHALAEPPPG